MSTFPAWFRKFMDRLIADGDEGWANIVDHLPLVQRIGVLLSSPTFFDELTALVARHEPSVDEKPALCRMPTDFTKLHSWMERTLTEFLGFEVMVPAPPTFNQRQRRLLKKMKLRVIFLPDESDERLAALKVKPNWCKYLTVDHIQRIPLPGKWVAYEVIAKPNFGDGKYADDKLMAAIGLYSRFNHPYSGKGEGDDLEEDILPKVAAVLAPLGGTVMVQSVEEFNFLGNFLNWLRKRTGEDFPDLASSNATEWCRNSYGPRCSLIVGDSDNGGLASVFRCWRDDRGDYIAFRFLAVFS